MHVLLGGIRTASLRNLTSSRLWHSAERVATRPSADILKTGMKTMTCKQLGGPCDEKLSAESWDEMVQTMVKHVTANHPETAEQMKKMHEADPKKWGRETKPKWDAAA